MAKKAKKKSVAKRTKVPTASIQFTFDGELICSVVVGTDERLVRLAHKASELLYKDAISQGGVPVSLGGKTVIANRVELP